MTLKSGELASYGKDFAIRFWNVKRFQNVCTINVEIKKYYIYFTQLLYGNIIFATGESAVCKFEQWFHHNFGIKPRVFGLSLKL